MSREVQDIGNGVGIGINNNFLQHEAPFVPSTTTVVTIFAGANDANTLATAIDRGAAGSQRPNAYIDAQIAAFAEDYRELVGIVRGRAPSARIFVLNLPNFAGVPFAVGRPTRDRQWLQRLSVGFSVQGANALVGMNVTVVDLLCNSRSYQASTYSSDGFHPNDTGYAYIARRDDQGDQRGQPAAAGGQLPADDARPSVTTDVNHGDTETTENARSLLFGSPDASSVRSLCLRVSVVNVRHLAALLHAQLAEALGGIRAGRWPC